MTTLQMRQLALEHRYVRTNGVTLHTVQAGPQDGPLVILLHGFPEYWRGWHRQIPYLVERGYRVWAPDQRGYHLSDKPRAVEAYRLEVLAADVKGLIEAAGRESAFVVGHDWGALVAWWTALLYPDRVSKLTVLNAPHPSAMGRLIKEARNLDQLRRSWYILFFQLPWLPERMLSARGFTPLAEAISSIGRRDASGQRSFSQEDLRAYRRAWGAPGAFSGMLAWYRAIGRYGYHRPADLQIRVPTLIIWGAQDAALSRALPTMSLEFCEDAQLYMIESATHWVQHDEPDRVNYLLHDFFTTGKETA